MSIFTKVKDKIIHKKEEEKEIINEEIKNQKVKAKAESEEVKKELKEKGNKEEKKQKTEASEEKIEEEKPAEKISKPVKKHALKTKAVDEAAKAKAATAMGKLLTESKNPPSEGDIIEGAVINIDKSAVYIDLAPFGTGIIFGKEFLTARDIIKNVNVGDTVAAKVIGSDNEDGYIELSLKEARQAIIWSEAESAIKNRTILDLPVIEANKGGQIGRASCRERV